MSNFLHDVSWVVAYRSDELTALFKALTWLGYPTFVMLLLPLGYWLWSKKAFTRIVVLVILSTILNALLKDYWENPRPDAVFRLDPGVGDSFGMPSGHAQIALVLWFGLAYEIRRGWAWIAACLLVTGISFSRIYLGIHDLEDILAGLSIGAISLLVYRWALSPRFLNLRSLPVWSYLLVIIVMQVVLFKTWPAPAHSVQALSLAAFLAAWLLGNSLERVLIGFSVRSGLWVAPLVIIFGISGISALTAMTKSLAPGLPSVAVSYITTFSLGFYMTVIAPYVFKLIGLSSNRDT
jgi:glycerophosphoryl diester phosphodiesterase